MTITNMKNDSSTIIERADTGCHKIGRKIKEFRLLKGLRQQDLGDKVGISHQQIQKYEAGINAVPIDKLCAIAEALSVDASALLPTPQASHEYDGDDTNSEGGYEMLSLMREYKKIKSQESRVTQSSSFTN